LINGQRALSRAQTTNKNWREPLRGRRPWRDWI